jgi:uncharacterized protein YbjQ (UPF0145 family)
MRIRRRGPDPQAAARAAESLRVIEAGGLPPAARERLASLRGGRQGFFTSALSTQEFLLVRQGGFTPVSQVMGSCFYHVGRQYTPGSQAPGSRYRGEGYSLSGSTWSGGFEYDTQGRRVYTKAAFGQVFELDVETAAWQEARRRAVGRLAEEARLAGADAVVGVRLQRSTYEWSRNVIEFVAVGTAVVSERYDLGDEPVLSNLSGQEFAKLYAAGYWPVGIVANTAVVYVITGTDQRWANTRFGANAELPDYTQGVQHARKLAVSRLRRDAQALDAAGVVGLSLDVVQREHEHERSVRRSARDMVVTAHALGTAIVELEGRDAAPSTGLALTLDGERR